LLLVDISYAEPMQNSIRTWTVIIAVVVLAFIVFALMQHTGSTASPAATATTTATSTQNGVTGTGNFQVTGDTVSLTVPDFRASIQFSPNIQSDVKTALQNDANKLKSKLSANSFDLESWISLGTLREMGGDYKGAETAWLFVTQAAPTNAIAFSNLGNLYQNFLKDYPKAEQAFLTAIKISPTDESLYINLYTMYANQYKQGTTAAGDILKKGVAAVPDSVNLHVELARYYKAKGDKADAKVQYDAAIAAANKSGQSATAAELQTEENQ
jgi:cytochrome c-type biogenesis protein CcmH/NrfG